MNNSDNHIIVIATNGWIFEGYRPPHGFGHCGRCRETGSNGYIRLTDASVVRSWINGRGIGGLADPQYKAEYTLDPVGDMTVYGVVAVIECRW